MGEAGMERHFLDDAILHPNHRDLDVGGLGPDLDVAGADRDGPVAALVQVDDSEGYQRDDYHDQKHDDQQDCAEHVYPRPLFSRDFGQRTTG